MAERRFFNLRSVLVILVQCLFVFLALEIILRIIFYQQTGFEKFATVEYLRNAKNNIFPRKPGVKYEDHYLVRPDSTNEINRKIADESLSASLSEYSPGTDYRHTDWLGQYINIKGFERKTIPSVYINPASSLPPLIIRFMGGSTMFGLSVTDAETIPSQFIALYKQKYPNGRSIQVINNGICGYHTYNELMLLSRFAFTGVKSDIFIFFDGLNDMRMVRSVWDRLSYSYYKLKLTDKNQSIPANIITQIMDSSYLLYEIPEYLKGKNVADSLIKRYYENVSSIEGIASLNNYKTYFFIQPVPFFNYPNKKNDPICNKEENKVVVQGYQKLEGHADSVSNVFFLGNMLENEKRYPFIDVVHYSPSMNRKIAAAMLDSLASTINDFK